MTHMYAWAHKQDHTHSCICMNAYMQTNAKGHEESPNVCKVFAHVLVFPHTLKTRGCRIISSPSQSYNQWPEGVPALRGVFFPKRPLLLLSVVVHKCTVKHLHLESALHFLLMHRTLNNAQLCFRRAASYSQRIKELSVVVYCDPAVWAGKPQHTCIPLCINTVIHTGGYRRRTTFYRSGNWIVVWGNAGR